jgi:hypothetical protein
MQTVSSLFEQQRQQAQRTPIYAVEIDGVSQIFSTHPLFDLESEIIADLPDIYFRMGERTGTTLADSSGHGLVATLHNSPLLGQGGLAAGDSTSSIRFNGTTQYASWAETGVIDPDGMDTFTVEIAFQVDDLASSQNFFDKGINGYECGVNATTGTIYFAKTDVAVICTSTVAVTTGIRHHFLLTKDGADVHMYLDGIDVTGAVTNQTIKNDGYDLQIGRYYNNAFYFKGLLQEFAFYFHALTVARAQAHAFAAAAGNRLSNVYPYMKWPTGFDSQLEPTTGRASIGSLSYELTDRNELVTSLLRSLTGAQATMKNGFLGMCYNDFATIHQGVIQGVHMTPDHCGYDITQHNIDTVVNRQVFNPAVTQLNVAMTNSDLSMYIQDATSFLTSGYVLIDAEYIAYSSTVATGIPIGENTWRDITYGAGLFVAVSYDGKLYTSPEGRFWTQRTVDANFWTGVSYSSTLGMFVAVASSGTNRVTTSTDGIAWTGRSVPLMPWRAVTWSSSLQIFCAVASIGASASMTSSNGTSWTQQSLSVGAKTVEWSAEKNKFVTVHSESSTGVAWASKIQAFTGTRAMAYSPELELFVMVGTSYCATSANGVFWTSRTITAATYNAVCWSSTLLLFVAVSDTGGVQTSPDGITWTARTQPIAGGPSFRAVTYGNGLFVAVGLLVATPRGVIITSPDGITWTERTDPNGSAGTNWGAWSAVLYTGSGYVAVASSRAAASFNAMYSSNGTSWTGATMPGSGGSEGSWTSLAISGSTIVAVSTVGTFVATSVNAGASWTARTAAENNTWVRVRYSSEISKFVAISSNGSHRAMSSSDGITWANAATVTTNVWSQFEIAVGVMVVTDASGAVMTSIDSTTWTVASGSAAGSLSTFGTPESVLWVSALSLFVAVSSDGTDRAASSTDGSSWTMRTAAEANTWRDLAWNGTTLVAVASSGTHRVMTSTNGTSWSTATAAAANSWRAIAYGNSVFVAVADSGSGNRAMYSAAGSSWTSVSAQLTSLTRGALGTTAAAHVINSTVQEMIRLGPSHPMDILLAVLENTDKTGMGMDASLIDTTAIAAIKTALGDSVRMEFRLLAAANGNDWIAENICGVLAEYPVISGDGRFSIVAMGAPGAADASLTDEDIVIDSDGRRPMVDWDTDVSDTLYNQVVIAYDYDEVTGAFEKTSPQYVDQTSIDRYGLKPLQIEAKGIRSDIAGFSDLMSHTGNALIDRFANPVPAVKLRTFLSNQLIEPGDIVAVTTVALPNPTTGSKGITAALMEVQTRALVFDQGFVDLELSWTTWND